MTSASAMLGQDGRCSRRRKGEKDEEKGQVQKERNGVMVWY